MAHVAQRAASTSGLSDVEMAEQLDDLVADARCGGDGEADEPAAPMAEEAAADSGSAVDAAPLEAGEEPSNWANLPDGILQEVRAARTRVTGSDVIVDQALITHASRLHTLGDPTRVRLRDLQNWRSQYNCEKGAN